MKLNLKNMLASIKDSFGQSGRYYRFGSLDNYPNVVIDTCNDSQMAKRCIDRLNQFTFGYGFKDKAISEIMVNEDQNMDSFIRQTIGQINYMNGFVWCHKLNYKGEVEKSYVLPIQWVRKRFDGSFIYREGLGDPLGFTQGGYTDLIFPAYNPNRSPEEVRAIIKEQNDKHSEQIGFIQYEFVPGIGLNYDKYPVPTHGSGLPDLDADAKHSVEEQALAGNSFKAEVVIVTGKIDKNNKDENGDTAYDRFVDTIQTYCSPDGLPVLHIEKENKDDDISVTPVDASNSREDRLHRSRERVQKNICGMFSVPPILVGISTEGKLGDNQEMVNHFKLFNLTLADKRELLLRGMKKAFPQFSEESLEMEYLNLFSFIPDSVIARFSDAEVREIYDVAQMEVVEELDEKIASRFAEFGVGGVQGILGIQTGVSDGTLSDSSAIEVLKIIYGFTDEQAAKVVGIDFNAQTGEQVAKPEINEAFRNITMMQLQRIQGIIKRYNKGTLTEEQARQLLISGFGMTADQADVWIITPEEDGVID